MTNPFGSASASERPAREASDVRPAPHNLAMTFRMARGASYRGMSGDSTMRFTVSIPLDRDGYIGRECPSCHQLFRMQGADYHALPNDLALICPYCGHREGHAEFMTRQQRARVMRVAHDAGVQMLSDAADQIFGSFQRSVRGSGHLTVTYRSSPFYPEPLPGIREEKLVRVRSCRTCGVRYAVFGDHRFCPVSGALDAAEVARDALAAEEAKLDLLAEVPEPQSRQLREQGVFDRIAVDTLGRVVGIVEVFASAEFRRRVSDADALLKGRGNIFQRLDDVAVLFRTHLGIDPSKDPTVDWLTLKRLWAARHAHVHADGRIDERYLRSVQMSSLQLGQRVVVREADARTAIRLASQFCEAISE